MKKLGMLLLASWLAACTNGVLLPDSERKLKYQHYISEHDIKRAPQVRSFRYSKWSFLSRDFIIISSISKKHYMIEFRRPCFYISSQIKISLLTKAKFTLDERYDAVAFLDKEGPVSCRIKSIYPLSKQQRDEILNLGRIAK